MAPLPPAHARVHGVVGEAERAGAIARHAVRRTSAMAVATAKVVLWLGVVVASLAAIGLLGRSTRPRYPQLERMRAQAEALRRSDLELRRQLQDLELARGIAEDLQQRRALADDLSGRPAVVVPPPASVMSPRRR